MGKFRSSSNSSIDTYILILSYLLYKNLSREKACAIYKKHYWDTVSADKIESQTKAEKIFDIGVNTGVRRTSKFAQAAAGLSDKSLDGFIGKQSIQAINKTSDELFMLRLTVLQVAHYTNICKKRPDSRKFLVGWLKRALGEHI